MDVFLARHAESIWNAEDRWQGQADVPLSERGRLEAAALSARLRGEAFDVRVSSDLARARDTSDAIAPGAMIDVAFREIDLGRWSGLLHAEVAARWPDEVRALADGADVPLGGGETLPDFEARALAALARVRAATPRGGRALVVTHGGVIRAIVMRLLGLRGRRPLRGVGNTGLVHLRFEGDAPGVLVGYGCTAHLGGRGPEGVSTWTCAGDENAARTAAALGLDDVGRQRLGAGPRRGTSAVAKDGARAQLVAYALPIALGAPTA